MKHFILFISLVLATGAFAQESFFQEYFSENFEEGTDIIKRDDNSYILGGWSRSYKGEEFQFLKIVDLAGTEISTKYISSENASRGHLICQDYDNMILILRDSTINDTSYMIISKVNLSGEEIESHAVMPGYGFGIVKDDEQGYYIIGKKDHQNNTLVVNLDNSFNVTWAQEYYPSLQNGQKTTPRSTKILNNNLYVIGDYYDSPGYFLDRKSFILCISESGDSLNCLNLDEYYNETYISLITTSDGNLITTGNYGLYYYEGNGSILKLTPDLDTIWHNSFYYDYGMYCDDLIETSDGDIIVCGGQYKSNFSSTNFFLKKINSEGENIWYNQIEIGNSSNGKNLWLPNEESILCIGYTSDSNNEYQNNSFLVKTDSEGNLLGINNLTNTQFNIQISPNPANDQCTIMINNIHGKAVSISVYNNFGQKVFVQTEEEIHSTIYKKNLNLESLTPGLYFIQIKIDGQMETKKIVIQ